MLVNKKNVKRFFRRPEWMKGLDELDTDPEHMEEIDHMDPPAIIGESNGKNASGLQPEVVPQPVSEPGQQGPREDSESKMDLDTSPDLQEPRRGGLDLNNGENLEKAWEKISTPQKEPQIEIKEKRWKVGDRCEVMVRGIACCGKVTGVNPGKRGKEDNIRIKYKSSTGKKASTIRTSSKVLPCEHSLFRKPTQVGEVVEARGAVVSNESFDFNGGAMYAKPEA